MKLKICRCSLSPSFLYIYIYIYIYNKCAIKRNILTIKQNTSGSMSVGLRTYQYPCTEQFCFLTYTLNWPECEAGYVLPPTADNKIIQTVPATVPMLLQGLVLNLVRQHNYSYGRDFFKIGAAIARSV